MIHVEPFPLNPAEEKAVRQWLAKSEAMTFRRLLHHKAAELTAQAGNFLAEYHGPGGAEHQKEDADDRAGEASRYIQLADLMAKLSDQTTSFATVKLTPKPATTNE